MNPQQTLTNAGINAPLGSAAATQQLLEQSKKLLAINPQNYATPTAPVATTPVNLDLSKTFSSQLLDALPKTTLDLQSLYDQNKAQQEEYMKQFTAASAPTALETDLTTQISDLRANTEKRLAELGVQPILTEVATRQQNLTREQAGSQEKLLLGRLGIEQSKRQGLLDTVKAKMGFGNDQFGNAIKVYDAINQQRQQILAVADRLSDNARQTFSTILDKFKGLDFSELDPQTQLQLSTLATQAGIPFNALVAGMTAQKNQLAAQKTYPNLREVQGGLYDVANNKWIISPKPDTGGKGDMRELAASRILAAGKGTDGLVSAQTYQDALRSFISDGGTQANFFASFPQQTYLRQQEIDKLPVAMQPAQATPESKLTSEQRTLVNRAKAVVDSVRQTYGDVSAATNDVIQSYKTQYGFDVGPYIR